MADVRLGEEEIGAVVDVLRSGSLREGKKCTELEGKFAEAVGADGATTVSSGTAALHAAYSYYAGTEDEVLVPAVSFFATACMVSWAGARPVFCDIDPETFCIDVEDARRRITERTRAIAPVHLFGNAADVAGVLGLAQEFDLEIVWDAAQAHLTRYGDRDVGSLRGATCYSLYATKNMTTGEGGLVASGDGELLDHVCLMKHQGQSAKYRHTVLGTNYRMTDMQAAIGIVQLERLPELTRRRRENARLYDEALGSLSGIQTPVVAEGVEHSYHQYTIVVDPDLAGCSRDEIVQRLTDMNVQVGINYPIPLHQQPAFVARHGNTPPLPVAEKFCETCLSLPVQPHLDEEEIRYVIEVVAQLVGSSG